MSVVQGDLLCACYACGKDVFAAISDDGEEHDGLIHAVINPDGKAGLNGETGCKAFDEMGTDPDSMIDFLQECRKALEAKRREQQSKRN